MTTDVPREGDKLAASPQRASAEESAQKLAQTPGVGAWRRALAEAIRDPLELLRELNLAPEQVAWSDKTGFPVLVPRDFVARMRRGDPHDPLLRQVLPLTDELNPRSGFSADPLSETACGPVPGMLHKYRGRVLLVTTGACAVHCRYCFRRHFAYDEIPHGKKWWSTALGYVAADKSIEEILLSGGDPLTLPDAQLHELLSDIAFIPHVRRVRFHTRLPIVLPQRIDAGFLSVCQRSALPIVMVVHANHPSEISPAVMAACQQLRAAGVTLLNQAVLLRGVNDNTQALKELSVALFSAGVLPYYLHLLDHVAGAAHFLIPDERARELHQQLAAELPGYLVPRLVREEPGQPGKTWVR
jgi:L-lysine 2,3-aminomutase